ncbi:MAG: DUF2283 domain-containing protein [Myxococcales bacterium]|nr:DUF2283 domain-containing protein [Myxococcales bacterium]
MVDEGRKGEGAHGLATGISGAVSGTEEQAANVYYDRETDSLVINLREIAVRESEVVRPGVVFDFGEDGGVVRIEILEESKDTKSSSGT